MVDQLYLWLVHCIVGIFSVDNRLTSALNMSHMWFGFLCLCAVIMLGKMAKFFLKSDQLAFLLPDLDFLTYYVVIHRCIDVPYLLMLWIWLGMSRDKYYHVQTYLVSVKLPKNTYFIQMVYKEDTYHVSNTYAEYGLIKIYKNVLTKCSRNEKS